ncbi:MAG: hypothetical protein ABFR97_02905 [Thermodesulfobacteriota bacterium]
MIGECPYCQYKFSGRHQDKIKTALLQLQPGSNLKFACPECHMPIELGGEVRDRAAGNDFSVVPQPPNLAWLQTGTIADKETLDDFSLVMILIPNTHPARNSVPAVFEGLGYKAVFPDSANDAIQRMRFTEFAAVVLHTEYEGSLARSNFHRHMEQLDMASRRSIYYVLLGPGLNTLYNLGALVNSANLTVGEGELQDLPVILKKSFREYDDLFSPFLAALSKAGKAKR